MTVFLYQEDGLQYFSLIEEVLKRYLNLQTIEKGHFKTPDVSFNVLRNQYDANTIIDELSVEKSNDYGLSLLVVEKDIYVPKMNFIFGLALPHRRVALVSTYRLDDGKRLKERLAKEIVHEVGHLLTLDHCENPICVMHFSNTIQDTDIKGVDLCPQCRRKFEKLPTLHPGTS